MKKTKKLIFSVFSVELDLLRRENFDQINSIFVFVFLIYPNEKNEKINFFCFFCRIRPAAEREFRPNK